MLKLLARKA